MKSGRLAPIVAMVVALSIVASGCGGGQSVLDPDADLVVYGAHIWDGSAGATLRGPALLQVSDGRVLSVSLMPDGAELEPAAAEIAATAGAAGAVVVDARGRYLIPGLVNAHGHVGGTWTPDTSVAPTGMAASYESYAIAELERYARFGVTTVAILGGDREPAFDLRDASWGEGRPGWSWENRGRARLLVAGPVRGVTTIREEV